MATKVKIDPVTRIEGHLKIEVEVEDGKVTSARSIGTLFRGIEIILKGRDPRDALFLTQRVCGVCPIAHATASALALDEAFGVTPPDGGRIIRNLILGANFIQSHLLHFYHLASLDYVTGPDSPPFVPRYQGDYRLPTEVNQQIIEHYLKALEMRMEAQQMLAIFGGKMPHIATFLPGGVTETPDVDEVASFYSLLSKLRDFIDNIYLPDVLTIGEAYKDYFSIGIGCQNLLAHGGFPLGGEGEKLFPSGVYIGGQLGTFDSALIAEYVRYSWYSQRTTGLHPRDGETEPQPTGILKPEAYSWLKAPRYEGKVLEVGPAARMMITYLAGTSPTVNSLIDSTLGELELPVTALLSTMGRHLARALECKLIADVMEEWLWQLDLKGPVYTDSEVPAAGEGAGLAEAPRGAVGHWLRIEERKIANYQIVTPTNWNASPRDDQGNMGPIEQALIGTPVADPENPIEVARVVRSFDPCLACAVHLISSGRELGTFNIN
jgi:hydrogenase large subunit